MDPLTEGRSDRPRDGPTKPLIELPFATKKNRNRQIDLQKHDTHPWQDLIPDGIYSIGDKKDNHKELGLKFSTRAQTGIFPYSYLTNDK